MNNLKNKRLFEEFSPVSNEEWMELIVKDLKGQDFAKKLIWNSREGIEVLPFYRSDIYSQIDFSEQESIIQFNRDSNKWRIFHEISQPDPELANQEAIKYIEAGVNYIGFNARQLNNVDKISLLLKQIDLSKVFISFYSANCNRFLRGLLNEYFVLANIDPKAVNGCFDHDPLTFYIVNGYLSDTFEALSQRLTELFDSVDAVLPGFHAININGAIYHDSGADSVQELAIVFSLLVEYLDMLTEKGLSPEHLLNHFQITFGVGTSYFMEIAKLRAARLMWHNIVNQYNVKNLSCQRPFIKAVTSRWAMGVYDAHTNILRATTQAMSAIIGGADLLMVLPFDLNFRQPDDFSKRIAKNIQLLLKEESHFDKVIDPAAGSYYIGYLTDAVFKKSWELFLKIEGQGGFLKCVESGFIQDMIEESARENQKLVYTAREKILGVNLYPDINEKMLNKIDPENFAVNKPVDMGIKVINPYRKAAEFEDLRLKAELYAEKGGHLPVVFMLPFGNPGMATARQIFSRNFFGVGGYQIIENARFTDFKSALNHVIQNKPDIVVLCSSDEEYLAVAQEIIPLIRQQLNAVKIVVAGNPATSSELQAAGVDDFIHLRTNLFEKINEYHKLFKIIS